LSGNIHTHTHFFFSNEYKRRRLARRYQKNPHIVQGNDAYSKFVKWFVLEPIEILALPKTARTQKIRQVNSRRNESFYRNAVVLALCAVGLQASYLTWGVLQERLITIDYNGEKFQSSQFLVFSNRTIAFCVAVFINTFITKSNRFAPFHKYAFASFSNIMSSWCQYEALKYVSFPTQVVSKSSKLILVMIVGKILADKTYKKYEYVVAGIISLGVIVFTLSQETSKKKAAGDDTAFGGILLLLGYITFDSFTSQWQGKVFKDYQVSPYQMMLGVNFFSATCTLLSLSLSGELTSALAFISSHPSCLRHIIMLSVCGATGQLFIFYTIKRFGPLVFTMIMTTRQLVSIILSCFIYSHTINDQGYVGAVIVFAALGYRIKRRHDDSKKKKNVSTTTATTTTTEGSGGGTRTIYTSVPTTGKY